MSETFPPVADATPLPDPVELTETDDPGIDPPPNWHDTMPDPTTAGA